MKKYPRRAFMSKSLITGFSLTSCAKVSNEADMVKLIGADGKVLLVDKKRYTEALEGTHSSSNEEVNNWLKNQRKNDNQ